MKPQFTFATMFRALLATGRAQSAVTPSKHRKGRLKSPFWRAKRKAKQLITKASRKLTRPKHSPRRRVDSKGKSAHSSRSW